MRKLLCITSLCLILSCSSEKPAEISSQQPSEVKSSGVSERPQTSAGEEGYSMEITPVNASRNSVLNLVVRGFNLSDAKIEWFVNERPTSSSFPYQFKAANTRKGDMVRAKAIIQGNEVLSNSIQITNAAPEVSRVKILPEVFKPGDTLSVDVQASDPDEERVTILYEWKKNGSPAGTTAHIDSQLRRGDKVAIKMTPFDGEDYGRPVILNREIQNLPPMIIEDDAFTFDGEVYTLQVRASDPDGDPLTYSLKSAPDGMGIDAKTGIVTWNVPREFTGAVPITVSVTDGQRGETTRDLTLKINPPE